MCGEGASPTGPARRPVWLVVMQQASGLVCNVSLDASSYRRKAPHQLHHRCSGYVFGRSANPMATPAYRRIGRRHKIANVNRSTGGTGTPFGARRFCRDDGAGGVISNSGNYLFTRETTARTGLVPSGCRGTARPEQRADHNKVQNFAAAHCSPSG